MLITKISIFKKNGKAMDFFMLINVIVHSDFPAAKRVLH